MHKSMLDPIVRALVGVDVKHHGVILDIVNKLGGNNADEHRGRLASALRESNAPSDTIVRINRLTAPAYPDWVKKVQHPELELSGPIELDLKALVKSKFDDEQGKSVRIIAHVAYMHLEAHGLLGSCLNLQDGLAIQKKGIAIFRQFFGGQVILLWGSTVSDHEDKLFAPYLYERNDRVLLGWDSLEHDIGRDTRLVRR